MICFSSMWLVAVQLSVNVIFKWGPLSPPFFGHREAEWPEPELAGGFPPDKSLRAAEQRGTSEGRYCPLWGQNIPGKIDCTLDHFLNYSATHWLSSEGASLGSEGPLELEDLQQAPSLGGFVSWAPCHLHSSCYFQKQLGMSPWEVPHLRAL